MNKLLKIICTFTILGAISMGAQAAVGKNDFKSIIEKSDLNNTSTIAVSIKNADTGKVLFEYNQNKLLHPASSLKLFTMNAAYHQLGSDFQYRTQLYKDKNNNVYLKLSGDPTLTSQNLSALFKELKQKYKFNVNDVVIDPTVMDNTQWGIGWMWDDDTSKYLPKYSPFTINGNIINISIKPSSNSTSTEIKNKSNYQMTLVNMVNNGKTNNIILLRQPWLQSDLTYVKGSVKSTVDIQLPVNNPERNFKINLQDALKGAKVSPKGTIKIAPIPDGAELILEHVSAPLETIIAKTLKDSNNLYAEMIFKTMGAEYTDGQGTTEAGVDSFKNFYNDISAAVPVIVDGSGASRNDLISADWMTEALDSIYHQSDFDKFVVLIAKPVEGTLSDRLLNISQNLRAKTGSISGASALTGYVDSKSKTKYSFAILIQNFSGSPVEAKKLEDAIVNEIYNH